MKLWRIATQTRDYSADDLSGGGAAKFPGRWNAIGDSVVYCADSVALAVLETTAHIPDGNSLPQNKFVLEIEVPEPIWLARQELSVSKLPITWDSIPAGSETVEIGSRWLNSKSSAILVVPSVITLESGVALVNPTHPDAKSITAIILRRFNYNGLYRR